MISVLKYGNTAGGQGPERRLAPMPRAPPQGSEGAKFSPRHGIKQRISFAFGAARVHAFIARKYFSADFSRNLP